MRFANSESAGTVWLRVSSQYSDRGSVCAGRLRPEQASELCRSADPANRDRGFGHRRTLLHTIVDRKALRSSVSMTAMIDTRTADAGHSAGSWLGRPMGRASARASRAGMLLALLGVASFIPVLVRLLESWRFSSHAMSHHVAILGQRLSYPAANVGAVIVLALAALGGIVTAIALFGAARELSAARRLARGLTQLRPDRHEDLLVIDDEHPDAFCAGLFRPRVYITTGALAKLDEQGLNAVLVHERHHARRRDPLRLAAGRVLARSLFFLPGVRELRQGQQMLSEVSADESALAAASGDRSALARAMLSFGDAPGSSSRIDPVRVEYLLGEPPRWRFPALMCAAAVALLAIVATVAILVTREAAGSATLAAPFLSAQPCIVMLALIPCGVGLLATRVRRIPPEL
jgi:Zn-dependent protease with chaperone function